MKKVSCNSRVTEIDTLISTILRQYEANAALAKDAFLKEMMAELAPLSRQLTEAIKRDRVSSGLADADGVRDAVIVDLGTLLEGYTAIPFEDQKAAAIEVKAVFDKYGKRIANESFARESSLIESLLIDLNAPVLSGAIKQLPGVPELISSLRRAQDDFNAANDLQTELAAEKTTSATSLRKEIIARFNERCIPYLNVMALSADEAYGAFIKQVEIEINRVNDTVSRRKVTKS
ncbi:MAG: hypothetical protein IJ165_06950 [Proteobacteria bacterium]|nr:hypothetical protein [Pseudomonadota bacterium]